MKLYFATTVSKTFNDQLKKAEVENVLISFAFFKNIKLVKKNFPDWQPKNLIIDSGAFSVWSRGESIDIDKYAEFCSIVKEIMPESNIKVVNLDVLPGQFGRMPSNKERKQSVEQGKKNYFYLLNKYNLETIPVFHQHEDWNDLKQMMIDVNGKGNYLGLSPANDQSMKSKLAWLNKAFSITKANVKCHGFAVTAFDQLIKYPFYSCDSSTWIAGGKFARIPTFQNGKMYGINFKEDNTLNTLWKTSKIKDIRLFTDYNFRNYQGAIAFKQMEEFITNVWNKRGIVFHS